MSLKLLARSILDEAVNGNLQKFKRVSPLTIAAYKGHVDVIKLLVLKGADSGALGTRILLQCGEKKFNFIIPRYDDIGYYGTPLQCAAGGHKKALDVLLRFHADPNLSLHNTFTPLSIAVYSKSQGCVESLLKAKSNPDIESFGFTPLMIAASNDLKEITETLIKAGANPDMTNYFGFTALEIAANIGKKEIVKVLFPVTSRISSFKKWSVAGVMDEVKSESASELRKLRAKDKLLNAKINGKAAMEEKKYPLAMYWLSEAIRMDRRDTSSLSNRCTCWVNLKRGYEALADVRRCARLRPDSDWSKAYYMVGELFYKQKSYNEAADCFNEGLKMNPGSEALKAANWKAIDELEQKNSRHKKQLCHVLD